MAHGTEPAAARSRPVTIGVFGHYGNENLGDEAIVEATIQCVRRRLPDARIICFSLRPVDTRARYGLPAYPIRSTVYAGPSHRAEVEEHRRTPDSPSDEDGSPVGRNALADRVKAALKGVPVVYQLARWVVSVPRTIRRLGSEFVFLWKSRAVLQEVDLLFFAGSNQFLDNFGGPWAFPYTVLSWALLAKTTRTRVAFVSVGAGPLAARLSMMMCRAALALADYQSVRDKQSKALLLGGKQTALPLVYPDLAFSLPSVDAEPRARAKPTVGINLMAIYNEGYWHAPDREKYLRYVRTMAELAAFVTREGYPTFLFGNQPYDELVVDDVIQAMTDMGLDPIHVPERAKPCNTVAEYMEVVRRADVVIATRFHGIVLALHAHRAVLGVCYGPKCADVLRDMGQDGCGLDLDALCAEDLKRSFLQLVASLEARVEGIRRRHADYRRALDEQYDNVLKLLA